MNRVIYSSLGWHNYLRNHVMLRTKKYFVYIVCIMLDNVLYLSIFHIVQYLTGEIFYFPDDLWELVQLSGVPINREVSKIVSGHLTPLSHIIHAQPLCMYVFAQIIELLKLNVPPAIILQMLKTLRLGNYIHIHVNVIPYGWLLGLNFCDLGS